MFTGFTKETSSAGVTYVRAGAGQPVLLLHGFPQTHAAWHRVAPRLSRQFTVIAADLPGYGGSRPPAGGYGKREVGRMLVRFMRELGFERFAVIGHDRGARVAYRMALDDADAISHLGVLDIVPTLDVAQAMSYRLALEMANWFVLAQPAPFPETLLTDSYVNHVLDAWAGKTEVITDEARAAYTAQFGSAAVRHAVCEDYRAAAGADVEHDRADRAAGRRIECPVLALWSARDIAAQYFEPLAVWRRWAGEVHGRALDCGHFLMEEAPDAVAGAIEALLARASATAERSLS